MSVPIKQMTRNELIDYITPENDKKYLAIRPNIKFALVGNFKNAKSRYFRDQIHLITIQPSKERILLAADRWAVEYEEMEVVEAI